MVMPNENTYGKISYTWRRDPLGPPDSEAHSKYVQKVIEVYNSYLEQSEAYWTKILGWWDLYNSKWPDPRDPVTEKWRANVTLPYPYSGVETRMSSLFDIFSSADPMVQAEGIGDSDYERAQGVEGLIDYTFRATRFTKFLAGRLREMCVQGTSFYKVIHQRRYTTQYIVTSEQQKADFLRVLDEVEADHPELIRNPKTNEPSIPDFVTDPQGFEDWRQMVNKATPLSVPPPPLDGEQQVVLYDGPVFVPIRLWDVLLDPLVEDIQDQRWVIHRSVVYKSWVEARTGTGNDKPFDPKAVEYSMKTWSGDVLRQYEQDLAESRGLNVSDTSIPEGDDRVELLEVWNQTDPQSDVPCAVVLNRRAVITKSKSFPFQHGQCSIGHIRNVVLPGHAYGISEFQQTEPLYREANTLRSLKLDYALLHTIPMFKRLSAVPLGELYKHFRPGAMLALPRLDAIEALDFGSDNGVASREISEIKQDIDETNATTSNVRGASATVGRVSATEAQGRVTQALLRTKLGAALISEDIHPAIRQVVHLWYERGNMDLVKRISRFPLTVDRNTLLQFLDVDYRFRGPTKALNREMVAQQLATFFQSYNQWLAPGEVRSLMKLSLESIGLRGLDKVITSKGTDSIVQMWNQKMGLAQQQGALQGQAGAQAQSEMAAPTSAPPEVMAMLGGGAESGGGGEAPAGPGAEAPPAE